MFYLNWIINDLGQIHTGQEFLHCPKLNISWQQIKILNCLQDSVISPAMELPKFRKGWCWIAERVVNQQLFTGAHLQKTISHLIIRPASRGLQRFMDDNNTTFISFLGSRLMETLKPRGTLPLGPSGFDETCQVGALIQDKSIHEGSFITYLLGIQK